MLDQIVHGFKEDGAGIVLDTIRKAAGDLNALRKSHPV
jgi:hypothetical protein